MSKLISLMFGLVLSITVLEAKEKKFSYECDYGKHNEDAFLSVTSFTSIEDSSSDVPFKIVDMIYSDDAIDSDEMKCTLTPKTKNAAAQYVCIPEGPTFYVRFTFDTKSHKLYLEWIENGRSINDGPVFTKCKRTRLK